MIEKTQRPLDDRRLGRHSLGACGGALHRALAPCFVLAGAAGVAGALGCSPQKNGADSVRSTTAGTGGTTSEGTADAGPNGTGGPSFGAAGTTFNPNPSAGGNGPLTSDAACAETALAPESIETEVTTETQIECSAEVPAPVALYIVLDNSGSMRDNDKWGDAVGAITEFVRSDHMGAAGAWRCVDDAGKEVEPPADLAPPPGAGSISVAIQYFHPENSSGNDCNGEAHGVPAVAMGPLPGNANAIVDSLEDAGPDGDTPTVGALRGGTQYCAGHQGQNADEKCVVVLVTDGAPNGCGLDSDCPRGQGGQDCVDPQAAQTLTPIAGDAFAGGVVTFTIGMNGVTSEGFVLLDAIAAAGGSDCTPGSAGEESCNVSTTGAAGLAEALNTIRESVQVTETSSESVTTVVKETVTLPCEWAIPDPPEGETFDKDLVNVTFSSEGSDQELGHVTDEAECVAVGGGWYYDDPDAPTRIHACPATCDVLESVTEARIDVLFGCATRPAAAH